MADAVIIAVVALLLVFAAKKSLKHFKGDCCCSSSHSGKGKKTIGEVNERIEFSVSGMKCQGCADKIECAIGKLKGVFAEADYKSGKCIVSSEERIDEKEIERIISSLGYKVTSLM